jgi:hypothetical protein
MLYSIYCHAECIYAECRYAECRYAERRGASVPCFNIPFCYWSTALETTGVKVANLVTISEKLFLA